MALSQFDYYIDKALNGNYLSQTKQIASISEKIEENLVYYSPTKEEDIVDPNWAKLLYYFYISCGSLLDLCVLIENRCKFYDPTIYKKAKKASVMESTDPLTSFITDVVIPAGEKFIDRSFQSSMSDAIDTLDEWIKIGKKLQDSETAKLLRKAIYQRYQMTIDLRSIDSAKDVLKKSKLMRNKLIASRRIVSYYLTKKSSLTEEQKKDAAKAFQKYLKKERSLLHNFFSNAMKYHD